MIKKYFNSLKASIYVKIDLKQQTMSYKSCVLFVLNKKTTNLQFWSIKNIKMLIMIRMKIVPNNRLLMNHPIYLKINKNRVKVWVMIFSINLKIKYYLSGDPLRRFYRVVCKNLILLMLMIIFSIWQKKDLFCIVMLWKDCRKIKLVKNNVWNIFKQMNLHF